MELNKIENATLGVVDYVVFGVMLLFSAIIGVYYRCTGGKQKTTKEYLFADGNMSMVPVAFSLVVSFMSAITILGLTSEMYTFGTMYTISLLAQVCGAPIVIFCYLPVFFKLQATSAYEYLELRFGVATRTAASCAFSLQMILYSSIVLYAPSLALSAVTGISLRGSLISAGLVCIFYSVLGGMKAILITDVFQACVIFASIMIVVIKGTIDVGGITVLWNIALDGGRIDFLNFNPDPTVRNTFWGMVIGGLFNYLSTYAVSQTQIQRLLTVNSLKRAQYTVLLAGPIWLVLSLFTCFSGLVVYAQYFNCDPYKQGRIDSQDQILPIFVMDTMSYIPGLAGFFIAGIFSACLSTISSTVNSLAAVTMEDYIKPVLKHYGCNQLSDAKNAKISQLIVLVYGFVCVGLALLADGLGGVLQLVLTVFGVVGGPLLGLFTLGMFFWIANETGALAGFACGLALSMWIGFGGPKPPLPYLPTRVDGCSNTTIYNALIEKNRESTEEEDYFWLYRLSYMWYWVIGAMTTLIVGLLVSAAWRAFKKNKSYEINPDLFSPVIYRILPRDKIVKTNN